MKKVAFLFVLAILCGGIYFYQRHQKTLREIEVRHQAELQAAEKAKAEAEAKIQAQIKAEADAKAKLLTEAKAKAEAEAKLKAQAEAEAKAKAAAQAPEAKLAAMQKEYLKTEQLWLPYKTQLLRLRTAEDQPLDRQDFDPALRAQAKTLQQQLQNLGDRITSTAQSMTAAKTAVSKAHTGLMAGGSKSEKYSAWYYVDAPSVKYPISKLKSRNRSRRIAYVSAQETRREQAIATAENQLASLQKEYDTAVQQKTTKEKELENLRQNFRRRIEEETRKIRDNAAAIIAQRKQLRDEIKTLQAKVGPEKVVAANATNTADIKE